MESNKDKFMKLVSNEKTDTIQSAKERVKNFYESRKVSNPIIGRKYHVSWCNDVRKHWILYDIVGDTCYLRTKSYKTISCHISQLADTNMNIFNDKNNLK